MNDNRPDTASTRDRLLREARVLFAHRGFAGASVRAITRQAGANLGAVTYHFESKQKLYEAVLDALLAPLEEAVTAAAAGPGTALGRIENMAMAAHDHLLRHPDQVAIIQHELALRRPLPDRVRRWIALLYGTLVRLIREGQAEGTVVPGHPGLLAASVIAQPFYFAMIGEHLAEAAPVLGFGPESSRSLGGHIRWTIHRTLAVERIEP